jgi:serine/threonine protein kinase
MEDNRVPIEGTLADRAARIREVLADCIRRRDAGENLPDAQVVAAHPRLMPELGQELRKLALVEDAESRANSRGHDLHAHEPRQPLASDSIPGYVILDEVHRGGQAVVYRAVQKSTNRDVAVKVMKEGPFAGPADKARFDREVRILGQLNHANIVTIHDSGEAASHFYYTMDYIAGQPLDVYVAAEQRDVDDLLRLFAKICEAVNAAHLRGIIHRDLKPGNIRVGANGEPHILDFGLAKLTESDTDASLLTMTGQFVGSLPWASPEQAEGRPGDIDVRTDVYSLGVILYQMLTGKFPYNVVGNMRDVIDNILTAEPVRPSVAMAPAATAKSSSYLSFVPSWLRRSVPSSVNDEIETIVLTCLAKDPARRYQTAGELAGDVRRYLAGEPIRAKGESGLYLLKKTLRRYRVPFAVTAGFVLLLIAVLTAISPDFPDGMLLMA